MNLSLRTRFAISSLVVIGICGLCATLVAIRLIDTGIINQAQDKVKSDLNAAREIYRQETENIKDKIRFTALRFFIKDAILSEDTKKLTAELNVIRKKESIDVLTLTDEFGRVIIRSRNPSVIGDSQEQDELVSRVLSDREVIAATQIVPREELLKEGKNLAEKIVMLGKGRLYVVKNLENVDKIILEDYYSVL